MSSPFWTPDALSCEAHPYAGRCWRLVEAQHLTSTLKLVDSLDGQRLLEDLVEATKPAVPPSLSAIINKVMDQDKLRPTPEHSLCSLRHTFEDRLTAIEAPEKLIGPSTLSAYFPSVGGRFAITILEREC